MEPTKLKYTYFILAATVTLADLVVLAYVLLDRSICLCRHLLSDYRTAAAAPPGPQIDTKHTPVVVGWMDGQ